MRCPDCNKFVSFDTDTEPELSLSVDDEGVVSGTARIVNTCAECSQELKEATLDVEIDLSAEVTAHRDEKRAERLADARKEDPAATIDDSDNDGHDGLEIDEESAERTDRVQRTDRHGKPITKSRYMKTFYGADVNVTVKFACGETFDGTDSPEVQAGGMDELV